MGRALGTALGILPFGRHPGGHRADFTCGRPAGPHGPDLAKIRPPERSRRSRAGVRWSQSRLSQHSGRPHADHAAAVRRRGQIPLPVNFRHFINLWETEAECEQLVLLAYGPGARKAEALAQPQHGLEALDRAPGCVEGLEAAHPRHGLLDPEVITLDPLLQVLADVMHRRA